MTGYYAQRLSAERLARCYALAAPRVQRYLEQEVLHLLDRIRPGDRVLELGCGYGRVTMRLAEAGADAVGIDVAEDSLALARRDAAAAAASQRCAFLQMDAIDLRFDDETFDVVACVQNGIAALRVDPQRLVTQAWRVLRPGGRLLLSTYTETIWPDRLAWFRAQAESGLVGPLDEDASRDGVIVCRDGFRSGRADVALFEALAASLGVPPVIEEVDASSLWCELVKPPLFPSVSPHHGTARPDQPKET